MLKEAHRKLQQVLTQAQADPEFLALNASLRQQEARYQRLAQSLTQSQQDTLTEYLGTRAEMTLRLLELACFPSDR